MKVTSVDMPWLSKWSSETLVVSHTPERTSVAEVANAAKVSQVSGHISTRGTTVLPKWCRRKTALGPACRASCRRILRFSSTTTVFKKDCGQPLVSRFDAEFLSCRTTPFIVPCRKVNCFCKEALRAFLREPRIKVKVRVVATLALRVESCCIAP